MSTRSKLSNGRLQVILAVLGLFVAILAWRCPYLPQPPATETGQPPPEEETGKDLDEGSAEPQVAPENLPREPSGGTTRSQPPPPPLTAAPAPEVPAEFTLANGEQRVLLSGQAAVGVEFNQISGERFFTLRVSDQEGSIPHAVLGSVARFPFRVAGAEYQVSVLAADYDEKTVRLRIDRMH